VDATDAELIDRTAAEPEAFAVVFDRHYDAIYRYAAARLGPSDGEEVAAQTFLVAFERLASYDRSRPDARPWLFGIATNLLRRHRRTHGRAERANARMRGWLPARPHTDDEAGIDLRTEDAGLRRILDGLPGGEREVLLLFAWAELSYEEIAQALHVPIGTVRSRLHRARRAVRAELALAPGGGPP
jgi:RNA polymerase sigma factor (sigma-70 family)